MPGVGKARSVLPIAILTVVLLLSHVERLAAVFGDRGPYAVAEYSQRVGDSARRRLIDLLVFYPDLKRDSTTAPSTFPLVVFSHGFLLNGAAYRSYGEHMASHGLVVVLPTYPMSLVELDHVTLAEDLRFVIDRCLEMNQTEGHALSGLIDPSVIGLSGHSLGGKICLLEAATDGRVRAAALLDPVDGAGPVAFDPVRYPSVAPERMPQIRIPLLLVGAQLGADVVLFTACAPRDENYERFFDAANPPAIEVTQLDVGHAQYVDPAAAALLLSSCAQGDVPGEWVRASSAAYLTAFLLGALRGDGDARSWLDARLAEDEAAGRVKVRRK